MLYLICVRNQKFGSILIASATRNIGFQPVRLTRLPVRCNKLSASMDNIAAGKRSV